MIIRHDCGDHEILVDPSAWPAITTFFQGRGAGSLIAPTWLLTAAHVARRIPTDHPFSVSLAEKTYLIARVLLHPSYDPLWDEGKGEVEQKAMISKTTDIALIELATPVENAVPYELYTRSDEVGREVVLLGTGRYGDGMRGVCGFDGQLRRVTNCVDEADARWLKFRFDEPPAGTSLEGVCAGGDSGGPAFIRDQSTFLLAGISAWQKHDGKPLGVYGCIEHYTRVSCFIDWIRATCH